MEKEQEKQEKKPKKQAGKGDKRRPTKQRKYDEGYDNIRWKSHKLEDDWPVPE